MLAVRATGIDRMMGENDHRTGTRGRDIGSNRVNHIRGCGRGTSRGARRSLRVRSVLEPPLRVEQQETHTGARVEHRGPRTSIRGKKENRVVADLTDESRFA